MHHNQQHYDLVLAVTSIIATSTDADDAMLVEEIINSGIGRVDAEKLIVFIPLAFGRIMLSRLGTPLPSSLFKVRDAQGSWVAHSLDAEPLYHAACNVAQAVFTHGVVTREVYQQVMLRSTEVTLANQALNDGVTLDGAIFSPPLLLRLTTDDLSPSPPKPLFQKLRTWLRR